VSVLLVLFGSFVVFRGLGFAGAESFASWVASARFALATMFLFTSLSHFAPMRKDLIAMVPPGLPRPDLLVYATGFAELAGAIGLLIPALTFWAACGLIALLVLMLPANVSAARRGILLRVDATPLWLRCNGGIARHAWARVVR
jgi:uncharacterized membrane protein